MKVDPTFGGNVIPIRSVSDGIRYGDEWARYAERMEMLRDLAAIRADMAEALAKLTRAGYSTRHDRHGDYSARLWKAAPIALPIDWQMGLELADQPRETVDQNQDW